MTLASFPGLLHLQFLIALQYAKTEGEGLGNFITWSAALPSNVVTPPLNSQVMYETDLAFCASYKNGTSASRELHQAYETYPG